jgi:cytochrome bd ubiquinol oxidase subunit II
MTTLWFILIAFMIAMYVLLDGFDLGAGTIYPVAAQNEADRRLVLRAIGPVWDGNEVWLIAAGGTLFFTFPVLYAASFSGFYLSLFIVVWLLIVRGVSIELRSHGDNPLWRDFWDGMFFLGSSLLAFFFGVAIANVVRGVPLDAQGYFFEPLWTNFDPRNPDPGILDWYTVLIGLLSVITLIAHGVNFIAVKTEGPLNTRSREIAHRAWFAMMALTALGTVATFWLHPGLLARFSEQLWGLIFPATAIGALLAIGPLMARLNDGARFAASGAYIVGMLASVAFALYPTVLPAINPAYSLTIVNAAAPRYGLLVGLAWWSIGMVLAVVYFVLIYRLFSGKVRLENEGY